MMCDKQQTINREITFSGKGLHTGLPVRLTISPAEENHGIRFQRTDLEGQPVVRALAEYVTDTSRGTTLQQGPAKVATIEHVMAAVWGCGIDNALIRIDGPEAPILDGSARIYVEEIQKAGLKAQEADREYYAIPEKTEFELPEKGVKITAYPDDRFSVSVHVDFRSKVVGKQFAELDDPAGFPAEVAPCRTFVFLHELQPLLQNNLIKGGDLDNAIVIVEGETSPEDIGKLKKIFGKPDIQVEKGYLNNLELRFDNEIARHKLLDVIGDLALTGVRLKGRIFAVRPGHFANTEFAKLLRKQIKRDSGKPRFRYDPNAEPLYDINRIKSILPHRPPFLLVDKVMHLDERCVVGVKNVTMNEPFFVGHFPDEPVMPGVLQVEAMAQCGGILALSTVPDPENYSTYFMKIESVKFKRKVVPGDTLMFVLELTEPIRRGIVVMQGRAYVGDQLASEALLMAQIIKNRN